MSGVTVREAGEADVDAIREVFLEVYGLAYPYHAFFDTGWLKRSVYVDDILMLVATDDASGRVLGTASVVLDVSVYSDLVGEFGRLAVRSEARGRGVGAHLMEGRLDAVRDRLQVGVVENRCVHPFSQRISERHGFHVVGFLPMRHLFGENRESISLYVRHFGEALSLRKNHPRIIPEAHPIAHLALENCGLPVDVIVDETSPAYPAGSAMAIEELTAAGMPSLIRIERGRLRQREVFGPMRLQFGFFKLAARHAHYLVARQPAASGRSGAVAGAVGYIHDDIERSAKIFELIPRTDEAVRPLLERLIERCAESGLEYIEVDVGADSARLQRTLLELGFLPVAYVPAMVFHEVERLDVLRMARLLVPPELGDVALTPASQEVAALVTSALTSQAIRPRIAGAIGRLELFFGLSDEQAGRVAGACEVLEFDAGSRLFAAGDAARGLLILIDGAIDVCKGNPPRRVGRVRAGEPLGELAPLTGEPRSATAVAATDVVIGVLSRDALAQLTRQRPDIGVVLYRNVAVSLGRKLQRMGDHVAGWDPEVGGAA